ncbi:YicC family protein [Stappia sp. F7233]|uniref:YicC family protein n=1 Tax=Stappia albiluteola TaxID=2758565 RepID=A0A839ACH5_9HYPH|nr:YicC/YloC family endoribonuclease [Stappia albiluteola]MBA5776815.1 YicC family protein [Stappia albiluteola]
MGLASMTGFSRVEGTGKACRWTWEMRSVNGKGLDIRLRLPAGLEDLEAPVREAVGRGLKRGNITIGLSLQRDQGEAVLRINETALEAVLSAVQLLHRRLPDASPPTLDGILSHKGVLELQEAEEDEADREALREGLLVSFNEALTALAAMRRSEGAAIGEVLAGQLAAIEDLTRRAEIHPARQPDAIRERLKKQVEMLIEASATLDSQRLHQEAALLATRADIREELDRLYAHVAAARKLIADGAPVGRKLDFLAQEFNRETNTLCSKSNDTGLTAIGLEMKAVVDQMREQIQNLE